MELAAMTGGRSSLEAPFFRSQLDLCLTQGEVFVAEQAGGIVGVLFVYAPGQDFVQEYVVYLVLIQPLFLYLQRRNGTIFAARTTTIHRRTIMCRGLPPRCSNGGPHM